MAAIKELGDGILASVSTVSDRVHAAISVQDACHPLTRKNESTGIDHQPEYLAGLSLNFSHSSQKR